VTQVPLGRLVHSEEVADGIVFLGSDEGRFITATSSTSTADTAPTDHVRARKLAPRPKATVSNTFRCQQQDSEDSHYGRSCYLITGALTASVAPRRLPLPKKAQRGRRGPAAARPKARPRSRTS